MVIIQNPTASPPVLEESEQVFTIEAIGNSIQDCSLSDTICHCDQRGKLTIPLDIGHLVDIYEDEESQEDRRKPSLQHLAKQQAM